MDEFKEKVLIPLAGGLLAIIMAAGFLALCSTVVLAFVYAMENFQ